MQELIDNLDVIERFHHPVKRPFLGEITEKQTKLYDTLFVACPKQVKIPGLQDLTDLQVIQISEEAINSQSTDRIP